VIRQTNNGSASWLWNATSNPGQPQQQSSKS